MHSIQVCFVGVGSIAKRHIRNLRNICKLRNIDLTIDAFRRGVSEDSVEGIEHIFYDIEDVPANYDAIFITNPTEYHLEALRNFQSKSRNFFIEKPVVSLKQIEEAKKHELKRNGIYYVACPLRYNAVIQHIKKHIDMLDVISIRCISSSYLPVWRPGKDYRETYSAHRELGGGVSIDLIHEWDYITYLFGAPNQIYHLIGKKSSLEIDSDDFAIYIAEIAGMTVELHLDYFGRKTIREIQLFTKDDTIVGDIANNKITYLVSGKVVDFQEERDDYQSRELNHFLNMVLGLSPIEDGYRQGLKVLDLAQGKL